MLAFCWQLTFPAYAAGLYSFWIFSLSSLLFSLPSAYLSSQQGKRFTWVQASDRRSMKLTCSMLHLIFSCYCSRSDCVCTNTAHYLPYPVCSGLRQDLDAQLSSLVPVSSWLGFLAGISLLISTFKERLLLVAGVTLVSGKSSLLFPSLWVKLSSILGGFAYSIALTTVFQLDIRANFKTSQQSNFLCCLMFWASLTPSFVLSGISLVTTDGRLTFIILEHGWLLHQSLFPLLKKKL